MICYNPRYGTEKLFATPTYSAEEKRGPFEGPLLLLGDVGDGFLQSLAVLLRVEVRENSRRFALFVDDDGVLRGRVDLVTLERFVVVFENRERDVVCLFGLVEGLQTRRRFVLEHDERLEVFVFVPRHGLAEQADDGAVGGVVFTFDVDLARRSESVFSNGASVGAGIGPRYVLRVERGQAVADSGP